jgi:hypothetical protein
MYDFFAHKNQAKDQSTRAIGYDPQCDQPLCLTSFQEIDLA